MSASPHSPVQAAGLPAPIGPYSPGMIFDRLVLVSGQGRRTRLREVGRHGR